MSDTKNNLLPCPFCGGSADIRHTQDEDGCHWYKVRCNGCGAKTRGKWVSHSSDTCPIFYAEVREEWNLRAAPVIPEGYAILPKRLTAENGAKSLLMGEFFSEVVVPCPDCDGDDEDCELCHGDGSVTEKVPVSWTKIKDIWTKAADHLSAAQDQERAQ